VDSSSVTVTPENSQSPTSAPVVASDDGGGLGLIAIIIIVVGAIAFVGAGVGATFYFSIKTVTSIPSDYIPQVEGPDGFTDSGGNGVVKHEGTEITGEKLEVVEASVI